MDLKDLVYNLEHLMRHAHTDANPSADLGYVVRELIEVIRYLEERIEVLESANV